MKIIQFQPIMTGPKSLLFIGLGDDSKIYLYDAQDEEWLLEKEWNERMKFRDQIIPKSRPPDERAHPFGK